jgi:hypothetical protein
MSSKGSRMSPQKLTLLRQATGRYATKYSPGGREKRVTRPMPSLCKVSCLEDEEYQEHPDGSKRTGLSRQGS